MMSNNSSIKNKKEEKSQKSSINQERSVLSRLSVGSLYKKLGIKRSILDENEEMKRNREEQIKLY